jgi:hypothetical protein
MKLSPLSTHHVRFGNHKSDMKELAQKVSDQRAYEADCRTVAQGANAQQILKHIKMHDSYQTGSLGNYDMGEDQICREVKGTSKHDIRLNLQALETAGLIRSYYDSGQECMVYSAKPEKQTSTFDYL